MRTLICAVSTVGLTVALATPALAQAQTTAPAAEQRQSGPNPNEVVCQKQEVIGTRLGTKRVCKTRAEWADSRTQDRHELERVQTQRGSAGQ